MFEVGGTAKSRSESRGGRRRRAGTYRTQIRCSVVDQEEKQENYFPVDLESSLIVYSSL